MPGADLSYSCVLAFTDENIPGGVIRGSEWHSHLGSMKVLHHSMRLPTSAKQALICSGVWTKLPHLQLHLAKLFKCHLFCCNCGVCVLQDFSVAFGHCPEITVYTGCCYFPSAGQLPSLWADHRKSLLSMLVEVSHSLWEEILANSESNRQGGEEKRGIGEALWFGWCCAATDII